ncbi:MAG: arginine repressor [Lachnospiraceae bacterium]|nr:arginine repressor [Lachnospiraceae bacterium]MBR1649784.1 arginine repressor [Lachnospiraceae bacterium]
MKSTRQKKLIELIEQNEIGTQEELALMLKKSGFDVTQATVSRDIRELGLTKVSGTGGNQKYILINTGKGDLSDKFIRVLKDGFVSVDMAQNILVIKTVSGMAMAVAAAIDAMDFSEIVGSIAGDDTIMAAVRTVGETRSLMEKIKNMVQ